MGIDNDDSFKDEEVISESNIRRASQMRCLDISL